MFQNKAILQNMSWQPLIVIVTILLTIDLYLLLKLFEIFNTFQLSALMVLAGGVVSLIGGYIFTKRSHYEVYPTSRQVFGGLLNGLILCGMIVIFLLLLSNVSVSVALYLLVILGAIEFLALRVSQGRRFLAQHVLGVALLGASAYLMGEAFSTGSTYIYIFIALAIGREFLSRITYTHLLSPWVNNIWNGMAIFVSTLVALPFVSNIEPYQEAGNVLSLPLWVGLVILFLSISVLFLQLFKRKIVVSKGYLQYKLQAWTLIMMSVSLFAVDEEVKSLTAAFVVIAVAYAVIEGKIFVKR